MEETKSTDNVTVPPHDLELEEKLVTHLEKQQGKKQSIQTFVDYIPDDLFYSKENQEKYDAILDNHTRERRKDIPTEQSHWISDLIDLKKKRDLLKYLQECQAKVFANKQSFKIIKGRHFAQVESI